MKKRSQRNLHQYLASEVDTDEILHSHAIRRVAKKAGPVMPSARRAVPSQKKVPGYRDSMVGSIVQYRDTLPQKPVEDGTVKQAVDDSAIVGNRPRGGQAASDKGDKKNQDTASIERRHHFIEPPKRNFNRFN